MSSKRIFALLSAIVALIACLSLTTFAVPPSNGDILNEYEPYYMDISGSTFGANVGEIASINYSNNAVEFNDKSSVGLVGVEYNYSEYSGRAVNTTQPYYLYFDYTRSGANVGESLNPRYYVWFGTGALEIDSSIVGSNSTHFGFAILEENSYFRFALLSGGNIQYNTRTSNFNKDSLDYYYLNDYYDESVRVYSFRIAVFKESGTAYLQALSGGWYINLIRLDTLEESTYNRLAFGVYDKIDGNVGGTIYGSARFNYIRYQDYNRAYETLGATIGREAYDRGYDDGEDYGLSVGYARGYDEGYDDGLLDGESSEIAVPEVISTIMNSTVTLFRNIFGFELFGINISALIGSIALVCVLAWLIRKLVK